MNIAFFVTSFPELSQTFVLNQITGMLDRGHNVDIYAYRITEGDVYHSDIYKYNLLDRTFCHGNSNAFMPNNKIKRIAKAIWLLNKCRKREKIALFKSLNPVRFQKEALSLSLFYIAYALIEGGKKYDIIQCHFGPNGQLAAKLKSVGIINGRIVTTFHGYDVWKSLRKKGDKIYEKLFEVGDLFLPVSEVMKAELVRLGCKHEKTIVHRMGVDASKFTPRTPERSVGIKLLTVGRLVEKKGIAYGIKAVSEVIKEHPTVTYRIVGDGPLRGELQRLIFELGIERQVEILGSRSQEEIRALLSDSDIFLAPSVTDSDGDKEGLPVVLMEASASALPVVSTIHSAIPELVEDGKSGFLVPERDIDCLADRLTFLIEHPEIWPAMGRAGRKKVESQFDINLLNDKLVKLYAGQN